MFRRPIRHLSQAVFFVTLCLGPVTQADDRLFRVASFNLENYLLVSSQTRAAKTERSRRAVCEAIGQLHADVVALQELGDSNSLAQLRLSLREAGSDYPHYLHLRAWDTNGHLGLLSKFPFSAVRPQTNASFLLNGRRFFVRRGFLEVDIQVNPSYRFTLISAHLKSKRAVPEADQSELRNEEALQLRQRIDEQFRRNPAVNLVVLGDLNDTPDSRSTRIILGKGRTGLVDTRPTEGAEGDVREMDENRRAISWTYYYAKEDTYSRFDYILLSRGMAREWDAMKSYILTQRSWGEASDHRPISAAFRAADQ